MQSRELKVAGAYVFTPPVFTDRRGHFVSPYQGAAFTAATGRRLFRVGQISTSTSQRGVVRGVHFTRTPPGMAKYVYCAQGRALDIVVDLRLGSPTFGRWDSVVLDPVEYRSVYLPVGVGHTFVALVDGTVMSYTLSLGYVAEHELAVSPFDPDLGLPLPRDLTPLVSERDRAAPSLAQAKEAGLLPEHTLCLELEDALAVEAARFE